MFQLPHFAQATHLRFEIMGKRAAGKNLTDVQLYGVVAKRLAIDPKLVKGVVESVMIVAADQLKKNGTFKLGGSTSLKLKTTNASASDNEVSGSWILEEDGATYDDVVAQEYRDEDFEGDDDESRGDKRLRKALERFG